MMIIAILIVFQIIGFVFLWTLLVAASRADDILENMTDEVKHEVAEQ